MDHWATVLIRKLEGEGFYGSLTLQFKDGNLTIIRKEETFTSIHDVTKELSVAQ